MSKLPLNTGSSANDGNGNTLREAMWRVDSNFEENYSDISGISSDLSVYSGKIDGVSGNLSALDSRVDLVSGDLNGKVSEVSGNLVSTSGSLRSYIDEVSGNAPGDFSEASGILNGKITEVSGDLVSASGVLNTKISEIHGLDEGVTAVSTGYLSGYLIASGVTRFSTVTSGDYAAKLPQFNTLEIGKEFKVFNDDSADQLSVFPHSTNDLGYGAGSPATIEAGEFAYFIVLNSSTAKTVISRDSAKFSTYSSSQTLTRYEQFGGNVLFTASATATLQPGEAGMSFSIQAYAATEVDPNGSEVIVWNGTILTGGDPLSLAVNEIATFEWDESNSRWIAWSAGTEFHVVRSEQISATRTLTSAEMYGHFIDTEATVQLNMLSGAENMGFGIGALSGDCTLKPTGTQFFVRNGVQQSGGYKVVVASGTMASVHWDNTNSRWIGWGDSLSDGGV